MALVPTSVHERFRHEELDVFSDAASGLVGAIAIHSTMLGPAAGGLRLAAYDALDFAIDDVLKLSQAMTLKNAAAGLDLGGGKAVLLDDGQWHDPELRHRRMLAFGRVLERHQGRYITAEDVGTTPEDMETIAEISRHVIGRPARSGDPSAATARTVFDAITRVARIRLRREVDELHVGVIGVGHVGERLTELLRSGGAEVTLCDVNRERADGVAVKFGALALPADGFAFRSFDVLAPCALGDEITMEAVDRLRCGAVCGAANNQLGSDAVALALHRAGILFVPDFLANCGGIIHVAAELFGFSTDQVAQRLRDADERLASLLAEAESRGEPPLLLARRLAEQRLGLIPTSDLEVLL